MPAPDLVIVESPGKTRKIGSILGPGYVVEASFGHVRDLPSSSGRRGARERSEALYDAAQIGITLDDGRWTPTWELAESKRRNIDKIRRAGASGVVWLATDLDREGEAIAWHLMELLVVRHITIFG